MNLLTRRFEIFPWWSRTAALVAGVVLVAWMGGCGSVSNKTDAGAGGSGVGGAPGDAGLAGAPGDGSADVTGTGGAPGDGGVGDRNGTGGAPGDAAGDGPPADGGGAARWDIDNWDNAQWGP
jgi:hypothetical protein